MMTTWWWHEHDMMMTTWWWRQDDDMNMTSWRWHHADDMIQTPKPPTTMTIGNLFFSRCTKCCKYQWICSCVANTPWNAGFSWCTEVRLRIPTRQNLEFLQVFFQAPRQGSQNFEPKYNKKHDYRDSVFLSRCTKCKYQWNRCLLANTPWNPGVLWCFPVLLRTPARQNLEFLHVFLVRAMPKPCFPTSSGAYFPAVSTRENNMIRIV